MEIQLAKESHIPGMIELLRQVGQVHREIRPDIFRSHAQKYDESALAQLLKDENRPIFVAVEGDAVLGYCFCVLRAYRSDPVLTDRQEVYIDDLCVHESCRGRGIASGLYRYVLSYAKGLGCRFITLNVWAGNDNAQKFYERMGMRPRSTTMEMPLEDNQC